MNTDSKKAKELARNTAIIFIGKGCTQLVVFLLLPLYTRVLGANEYGIMDLITTYVVLLAPLISLQLENAAFRGLIDLRNNEKRKKELISSSAVLLVIMTTICAIVLCFLLGILNIEYGFYLTVLVIATMLSNYFLSVARGLGKNVEYAKSSIIAGGLSVILNLVLLLAFRWGIKGVFVSQIIANMACCIYCYVKLKMFNYMRIKYCKKMSMKKQLKYSLPLVPNSVNWWIINASDKTLVSLYLGSASNGIYSVSNKFPAAFIAVYNIFNLSWMESASLHIKDKDHDGFLSSALNGAYRAFYGLALLIIAFLPFLFRLLVGEEYADAFWYIPLLLFGSLLNVVVGLLSGIYIAKKLTKEVAVTSLFAAIINVATNILLINRAGIWAAVLSTIIAFGAMAIYRLVDVRKYVKLKINLWFIVMSFIIFFIASAMYLQKIIIINIVNAIFCVAVALLVNKKTILLLKTIMADKVKKK